MTAPMAAAPGADVGAGRRVLDVAVSLTALTVLAPVLLVVAAAVRCTSRGPVLFRQRRVGAGQRPFVLLKFRTMTVGDPGGPQVTSSTDARVTTVGRVLRRSSLDELPQLWNVLRGQMTLVGPRPETIDLAARYPEHCRWVLDHVPGLTGPSQIRFRDADCVPSGATDVEAYYLEVLVPQRVAADATYLQSPSVRATLTVMAQTLGYLLGRRPSPATAATT
jgi:lipopolysaccharide/colanic/teichoic acid biosynthesis glycosyltransferase